MQPKPGTMRVSFERTGRRRYAVRATRPGHPAVHMDPAPGFDERLPHDLIHFVVEQELGLSLGVFGQLAAGGDAGSFHVPARQKASREWTRAQRRTRRRGEALSREGRADGALSERAASICEYQWLARSGDAADRSEAASMAPYARRVRSSLSPFEQERLDGPAMERICRRLDEVSARWRELGRGESMTLSWPR